MRVKYEYNTVVRAYTYHALRETCKRHNNRRIGTHFHSFIRTRAHSLARAVAVAVAVAVKRERKKSVEI